MPKMAPTTSTSFSTATTEKSVDPESQVRSWGFSHVFTWRDRSNAYYPPHTHSTKTTHLIRSGSMTISYPSSTSTSKSKQSRASEAEKETHGVGARIDVPAGKLHEVWIGEEGCEYVIGEM